jgi:hypothetical protein
MALSYAKPYFPYTRIDKKRASGEGKAPETDIAMLDMVGQG